MKEWSIFSVLGVALSTVASLFGGWDAGFSTLVIFMGIDIATGFVVSAFFKNSKKTETGALNSNVWWKGLSKKGVALIFVYIGVRLDMVMGTNFIRDAVVISFLLNEIISIVENAGLMGVPIPKAIVNAIDVLKSKSDSIDKGN